MFSSKKPFLASILIIVLTFAIACNNEPAAEPATEEPVVDAGEPNIDSLDESLFGIWVSEVSEETAEFREDGSGYQGEVEFTWTTTGDYLSLVGGENATDIQYAIVEEEGGVFLILYAGGQQFDRLAKQ